MNEHGQQNLTLLGTLPNLKTFPESEIRLCHRLQDAYYETIRRSGRIRKGIEADCGIRAPQMSRIFEGSRNMPSNKRRKFFEACGNIFALQWELYQMGFHVERRQLSTEEKAELWDQYGTA